MTTTVKPSVKLIAADLKGANVITIPENMSIKDAARVMAEHQIRAVPVVDTDGRVIGVFRAMDFVDRGEEEGA
jgi:CBS domain-containing protein